MKRGLVSTTSLLALLTLGTEPAGAAPVMDVRDATPPGVAGRPDVVRDSLAFDDAMPAPAARLLPFAGHADLIPRNDGSFAASPTVTFTLRTGGAARNSGGGADRRNPGNVSNLYGTIGSAREGLFTTPAAGVVVASEPPRVMGTVFSPVLTEEAVTPVSGPRELVLRFPEQGALGTSVFVGVRPAVPDDDTTFVIRREAAVFSATGSAAPTILTARARQGLAAVAGLPESTTIGFSTADTPPTDVDFGAAASSTLGYTYRLSTSRRASPQQVAAPAPRASTSDYIGRSTIGNRVLFANPEATQPQIEAFPVGPARTIAIPLRIAGELPERGSQDESLFAFRSPEMGEGTEYMRYSLIAAVVLLPAGLALWGYQLVRRATLRRLG